jgi:hypothetical protein
MSKLMIVLGVLAVALGVAMAVLGIMSPGQMQIYGLTTEVAAIFLMGGILAIALGGVLDAVDSQRRALRDLADMLAMRSERFARTVGATAAEPVPPAPAKAAPPEPEPAPEPKPPPFAGITRTLDLARDRGASKPAESKPALESAVIETKLTTRETIIAIEKAKADIESALGGTPGPQPAQAKPELAPEPATVEPEAEPPPELEAEAALGESEEEQLYVIEEKLIRARPARVLSDGTVEAETDEGWMRFENLEHLEEYLDAMSPAKS